MCKYYNIKLGVQFETLSSPLGSLDWMSRMSHAWFRTGMNRDTNKGQLGPPPPPGLSLGRTGLCPWGEFGGMWTKTNIHQCHILIRPVLRKHWILGLKVFGAGSGLLARSWRPVWHNELHSGPFLWGTMSSWGKQGQASLSENRFSSNCPGKLQFNVSGCLERDSFTFLPLNGDNEHNRMNWDCVKDKNTRCGHL